MFIDISTLLRTEKSYPNTNIDITILIYRILVSELKLEIYTNRKFLQNVSYKMPYLRKMYSKWMILEFSFKIYTNNFISNFN